MKRIPIVKNLNIASVDALLGEVKLSDEYYNELNKMIEDYVTKHGQLPEIEFAYGFRSGSIDNPADKGLEVGSLIFKNKTSEELERTLQMNFYMQAGDTDRENCLDSIIDMACAEMNSVLNTTDPPGYTKCECGMIARKGILPENEKLYCDNCKPKTTER